MSGKAQGARGTAVVASTDRVEAAGRLAYGQLMPVVEAERDRESRGCHAPQTTLARKLSGARLKTSGSSRLAVWPVRGKTTRPAAGDGALEHYRGLQTAFVLVADQQDRGQHLVRQPHLAP